jgi:hypothetical protein
VQRSEKKSAKQLEMWRVLFTGNRICCPTRHLERIQTCPIFINPYFLCTRPAT